ncbi:MAG: ATP-binding protein [Sulfolobaceae archaeon]
MGENLEIRKIFNAWVPIKFVFGKPTEEPYDREKEINELVTLIRRKQSVILIGSRRIGKTSILLKVLSSLNTPKVYISAEDFVEGKSFDIYSFFLSLSSQLLIEAIKIMEPRRRIVSSMREKGERLINSIRDLIGYIKISLNINLISLEIFLERRDKFKHNIRELADLPQQLAEKVGQDFVIVIDEFQYLKLAEQNLPGLFHVLRSKWQFHKDVEYVVSGSSIGVLERMISKDSEPFFQFFFPIYVKPFTKEVSKSFLRAGFESEGKPFDEVALDIVIQEIDGYPAWLNYFSLKALNCDVVNTLCTEKVLKEMVSNPLLLNLIKADYDKLGKNAKRVIKFLAEKGGVGSLRGIGLNRSSVNEGLKSLLGEGYIGKGREGDL